MEKSQCNVCCGFDLRKIQSIEGHKYTPADYFNLICCNECGLVFIDIDTDRNFIKKYYPENYKPHDPHLIRSSSFRKTLMQAVRNFVFGREENRPSIVLTAIKQTLFYLYNKTAYRSIPFFRGEGKLLDIGCGTGEYLRLLKDIGWSVQGVEPVEKAALAAKNAGINVEWKSYEEVEYPEKSFDVITMWHVLEHFPDPKRALQKVSKMLKDDGLLLIGIPNYDSFDRRVFREYWNGFEIPLHIYHFTPGSIKNLLNIAGFNCMKVVHTIRPADMASSLENYFASRNKSKNIYIRKVSFLLSLPMSYIFSLLRRSSIIVVYAQKRS